MNQIFMKIKTAITVCAMCILITTNAIADNNTTPKTTTFNIPVSTSGGLLIGSKTDPFWFQLGGAVKFDQRAIFGSAIDKGDEFKTGANLRSFEISFNGGIGQDITYTFLTNYDAKNKQIKLDDAYLTYLISENFTISAGQVLPGFSLHSTTSAKWLPVFEKSMHACALGSSLGLGLSLNKWDKNYTFIAAASQPKQDSEAKNATGANITNRNDRWQVSARFAHRPIYEGTKILQLGAAGYFQDDHSAASRFKSSAEIATRNAVDVLDTGYIVSSNHKALDLEIAGQNGPLYGEAEYTRVFVTRPNGQDKLQFHGYHVLVAYVLTGEAKEFKPSTGVFGQVKPSSPKGAWEIAARYSFLNLNKKNINGGRGHNTTFALNYYVNNNVKIAGEYTRAIVHPHSSSTGVTALANYEKRKLNVVGLRLQAVF